VRYVGFKTDGRWSICDPCGGKRGYFTRRDAKASQKRLVKHQQDKASRINVYRCPHNDQYWHVGHGNPHHQETS